MRRAVVDDPEHAARVVIGGAGHDLLDEAVEGGLAAAVLTTTEDAGSMHIERRQVGPGATSGVFMFDLHRRAGLSRDSGMPSSPGLHTGFLIGRDHEFVIAERFRVPIANSSKELSLRNTPSGNAVRELWSSHNRFRELSPSKIPLGRVAKGLESILRFSSELSPLKSCA